MKRAEQLHKLSKEHHQSLVMAKKISNIAKEGGSEDLEAALDVVKKYYRDELEQHFQHEERTIFALIFKDYREHTGLATGLLKEHGYIRMLIPKMTLGSAKKDLAEFGLLLKNHTRMEERELFPIIEDLFTEKQLDAVLNFAPLD